MKVLIIYSNIKCSCTLKGTFEIQKGLKNYAETDVLSFEELTEDTFKKYDVVKLQRLGGNGTFIPLEWCESFKLMSKKFPNILTVYSIDDLLFNPTICNLMNSCDLALVPNKNYIPYFEKFSNNFKFYPNYIDCEAVEASVAPLKLPNCLKLVWASTGLLGQNFMHKLFPEIIKHFPNSMLYIICGKLTKLSIEKNVTTLPVLGYREFVQFYKHCDICLNPISVDKPEIKNISTVDFIECKSQIKYLNAAMCKIPIISSKSYSYSYAIRHEENGIILDNDIDQWIEYIGKIQEGSLRDKIIHNAYTDVSNNYNLDCIGKYLHNMFKGEIDAKNS